MDDKNKNDKLSAAITGAAVGAALTGAALILSKKENRQKLQEAVDKVSTEGKKQLDQIRSKADNLADMKEDLQDKVEKKVKESK